MALFRQSECLAIQASDDCDRFRFVGFGNLLNERYGERDYSIREALSRVDASQVQGMKTKRERDFFLYLFSEVLNPAGIEIGSVRKGAKLRFVSTWRTAGREKIANDGLGLVKVLQLADSFMDDDILGQFPAIRLSVVRAAHQIAKGEASK